MYLARGTELQAECLTKLESGWLRQRERDLVRWALNAKWSKPLRAQKKRLALLVYKRASALEVLVSFRCPCKHAVMDTMHGLKH